jgi:hypothetical protein
MGVALSAALAEFEALFSPAAEHRIEEQRSAEIRRDEIGVTLDEGSGTVRVHERPSSQEPD